MERELLKGHSKLMILSTLAAEPMHGYALSQKLRTEMPGMFAFGVGMLYPLLHALEKDEYIEGVWNTDGDVRKKIYQVTKKGKKELAHKKKEWRLFSQSLSGFIHLNP
ncbi:MAG: PadR family transcriptional regulator [Patescibacteria group bacterium]